MDLTKIDKPFGELDDTTKGALLLAYHRGDVIEYDDGLGLDVTNNPIWSELVIYRVQHKPVIGEVVLYGVGPIYHNLHPILPGPHPNYKLRVTFPTRDGQHAPGIYTSPEGMQIKIEVAE